MTGCIQNKRMPARLSRYAWIPIPLLLAMITALWVADLRMVYESRAVMVLLNLFLTWLASLCICVLTARGFWGNGQPGLLMFGCGSLLWGSTSLVAALLIDHSVNTTVTVHNLGVCGAAFCHLVGLLWRGRLQRQGRWLVLGYASALSIGFLIVWATLAGVVPTFFVQGRGGTPVRQVVLLLAIVIFAWVAWQMIYKFRLNLRQFDYWYGLGLALVATGLIGVLLLSVQGGMLGWTNRLTQYLGSAYLFVAALMAARESGGRLFSLSAVEVVQNFSSLKCWTEYCLAFVTVATAMGLRLAVEAGLGQGLPAYVTFYPATMLVALLAGFGPGFLAAALSTFTVAFFVLPPPGQFAIASPLDRAGLAMFVVTNLFMCGITELYRRNREKASVYDRELALRESQERLATFAEATFEGIVQSQAGRIVDCNEKFGHMLGYSMWDLKGVEIASLVAPEDRDRVLANIRHGHGVAIEHSVLCKDGTRIIVEAHGRTLSPGSPVRHTAIRDITKR